MKNIIIFGAGGHGKVIVDIVEKEGKYKILGFLDGNKKRGEDFYGYKVLGDENYLKNTSNNVYGGLIAVGDNWIRSIIVEKINNIIPDFVYIKAIHPSSSIGRGVKIENGTVVMANSVINSDTHIGKHCIINTKSSIGHDNIVGDYVTFAPGTTLGGNGKIGDFTTVSLGSNIIHSLIVGEHTVVGAGSTVLNNIGSYLVVYGTPAKIIRNRKKSDKYL